MEEEVLDEWLKSWFDGQIFILEAEEVSGRYCKRNT